ncbi:MAG: hypothetical protein IJ642_05635 [Oscillospiraceae bacterium]|nr:hypothetical protein [Oscillospiraceae bacterium]
MGVPWKAPPQDGQQPKRTRYGNNRTRFCAVCCISLVCCCDQIQNVAQTAAAEEPGTYAGLSCRSV